MIQYKEGVQHMARRPDGQYVWAQPPVLHAISEAERIYRQLADASLVVTSLLDGEHRRGSLHYVGLAVDLRIRHVAEHAGQICMDLARALGDDYDVILEETHIHVEYQPKGPA